MARNKVLRPGSARGATTASVTETARPKNDDPHTVEAMEGIDYVSFGLGEGNRIHAANMCPDWRHFDVVCDGETYCHLDMGVLGKHNAMNALAAAAAAWMMGIPGEAVSHGIEAFHGAGRRLEFKGTYNGADIYEIGRASCRERV